MFIPPVAIYVSWIGILYAFTTMNALSSYANSAVVLFLIMTWITMNLFLLEEVAEKHILMVHLKRKSYFLRGKWIACLVVMLPLIAFAHLYPVVFNVFVEPLTGAQHILSLYCHLVLGAFGILIGSFFAGTGLAKRKYAWLLTALTVTASMAYSQLAELLPSWLGWILWLLPPLRYAYGPLKDSLHGELPPGFLASFSLSLFYLLIVGIIVHRLFHRHEDY